MPYYHEFKTGTICHVSQNTIITKGVNTLEKECVLCGENFNGSEPNSGKTYKGFDLCESCVTYIKTGDFSSTEEKES